jgi:hypothetical protein
LRKQRCVRRDGAVRPDKEEGPTAIVFWRKGPGERFREKASRLRVCKRGEVIVRVSHLRVTWEPPS